MCLFSSETVQGVTLPDSVVVNSGSAYPGAGFFPPAMAPIPISNPEAGLQNIRPTTSDSMFNKRISLMNEFDGAFQPLHQIAIPNLGLFLGEMWDPDGLAEACAADGRYDFLLTAAPLPITGAVGSPVNPIAVR